MSFAKVIFVTVVLSMPSLSGFGQAPAAAAAQTAAPQAVAAEPATASKLLQPSLDEVQQTVSGLHIERWKKGSVRDEATDNVAAIQRDIKTNLPPLLATADAAPAMTSKSLPVLRNIDALYDVLLRVNEGARVSAPADQVTQIDQALNSLQKARLALNDSLQDSAALTEKRAGDLQAKLDEQASVKCPVVPAPSTQACTPAPARKVRKKPAPPATAAPATPAPATATPKPQN
jgi:hypothetical protein